MNRHLKRNLQITMKIPWLSIRELKLELTTTIDSQETLSIFLTSYRPRATIWPKFKLIEIRYMLNTWAWLSSRPRSRRHKTTLGILRSSTSPFNTTQLKLESWNQPLKCSKIRKRKSMKKRRLLMNKMKTSKSSSRQRKRLTWKDFLLRSRETKIQTLKISSKRRRLRRRAMMTSAISSERRRKSWINSSMIQFN